jgi:N-acetylglucosaminyldiphosphoundecaprenol N-acetyl-beta-D-mannosaminyltransferase
LKTPEKLPEPQTIVLLGIPFHDLTMTEALHWIGQLIEEGRPSYIVTANLDFAAQASKDDELHRIFVEADLVLCDGMPLRWISKLTRHPLRERVAGSDLIPKLAARAASSGWRLFLLGGDPASLEKAAENLHRLHPGLIIAGTYSPPFAPLHELNHADITNRIKEASPDILLVAFGCPKQEKWIFHHYRKLGVPCCIGVGATIDFLAGKVRRAPQWIANLGLEWVFRMLQEPERLAGRYLTDIVFLFSQLLKERKSALESVFHSNPLEPKTMIAGDDVEVLRWVGPVVAGTVSRLSLPSFNSPFLIDISKVTLIDSRGLGHFLQTLRKGWKNGRVGCFVSPPEKVLSVLEMTRLTRVIPTAETMDSAMRILTRELDSATQPPLVDEERSSLLLSMPQHVTGDTTAECQAALSSAWHSHSGLRNLQLDFGSALHMDSAGLGFVLHCHQLVQKREGGHLKLLRVPHNILAVIKAARLEMLLDIAPA